MENRNDILNELKELSTVLAAIEKTNVFTVPEGYFEYLKTDILLGIENANGLIKLSSSKAGTDIPVGYFDSLPDSILNKIKTQVTEDSVTEIRALSPVLYNIQNENIFETPVGYFDSLAGSVLQRIKAQATEDSLTEIRALSPMLYSIQNEHVFEAPQGYFENLYDDVLHKVLPQQPKVITLQSRSSTFFKYAVAAAFTGVMALGVFKFTDTKQNDKVLPEYVTAGMQIKDVDNELAKISDADIVKYLEANGTDINAAIVANSTDKNELPSQEDYLMDEKTLDKYLNSINIDDSKN